MTTLQRIQECIHEASGVPHADITPEAHLYDDLMMGAWDIAGLMGHLEEEFGAYIPGQIAESFRTVQDILTFIQEAQA